MKPLFRQEAGAAARTVRAIIAEAVAAPSYRGTATKSSDEHGESVSGHDVPAEARDLGLFVRGVRFLVLIVEPVLSWLVAYPLILLEIVLFCAVSWAGFGTTFGLPDLVWEEWGPWQFFAGLSVSLLFGNVLFVRYMLDTRAGAPDFGERLSLFAFSSNELVRKAGGFLFWTWVPTLAVFYVPKVVIRYWGSDVPSVLKPAPTPAIPVLPMLAGLVLGVLFTVGLVWAAERTGVTGWIARTRVFRTLPGIASGRIPGAQWPLHAFAAMMAAIPALFLTLFGIESLFDAIWSPVWLLCLILALLNLFYGFLVFHLSGFQYVFLLLCVALGAVSNYQFPFKMSFPGLDRYDPAAGLQTLPNLDEDPATTLPPGVEPVNLVQTPAMLEQFHRNWTSDDGPGKGTDTKPKLVIVCTSGGGIRAAVWTAAVLEQLESEFQGKQGTGFQNHIRLFTGASGGMVGAALYASRFGAPSPPAVPLSEQLGEDSLWPTVQTMLFRDLPAIGTPLPTRKDRGRSLEEAWYRNTKEWPTRDDQPSPLGRVLTEMHLKEDHGRPSPLESTFKDLRDAEAAARRPSLVFAPMLVEDCRRVLISNLDLADLTRAEVGSLNSKLDPPGAVPPSRLSPNVQSVSAFEFWRYFPAAYDTFKVGTAARMNATFPYVGVAVNLPSRPPRRVVDAGYFDDYGLDLAALWVYRYREQLAAHTSGVVLIEVRAYPLRTQKILFESGDGKSDLITWGLSELSTPAEALLNLYGRGAYFRNDQLMQLTARAMNGMKDPGFFTTMTLECESETAALSWTLPKSERDSVIAEAKTGQRSNFRTSVSKLKTWFGNGGGP
ncbi:patatin-like phospholipase family protein [Fimbriiglobus ruber]|uniref:patatin-like phospholipase family protein n=1 Tax=Fimbriiglobus ruber TaxID=1908690 RepID=UPI00117A174B|nr:patatin-like phospholipase family protein [Fimbriiglobus ruber]